MTTITALPPESLLHIQREIEIDATAEVVFASLLEQIGPTMDTPDGKPFPMKIEPWPGGRWFRDLGNNAGHLWGHVQVIKPPKLLEICGPLPMSFAVINHVQWRVKENGRGAILTLTHRAVGEIPPEFSDGMPEGWDHNLRRVRERALART